MCPMGGGGKKQKNKFAAHYKPDCFNFAENSPDPNQKAPLPDPKPPFPRQSIYNFICPFVFYCITLAVV